MESPRPAPFILETFGTADAWVAHMVCGWRRMTATARATGTTFSVALAGGSTPRPFYAALAKEPLDWSGVLLLFGDERHVPPDHPDSNYRMVRETLLDPAAVPESSVLRWPTELPAEDAARAYGRAIVARLGPEPRLDLALLGIGADGHTASLFPGTPAVLEQRAIAVANPVPKLDAVRLTLTFPVLCAAGEAWFLLKGPDKAEVMAAVCAPGSGLPAARVRARYFTRICHCRV